MDVTAWLRGLGLSRYEQAFRDHAITGEILPRLTADDLKELGVSAVGDRRVLLDSIAALRSRKISDQAAREAPKAVAQAEGERRQVTVIFADLAGFTVLSNELDPENIQALLEHFFARVDRIIEEHGGHVDKHIGDCVMGVFGAPIAHGNDAERGVQAALSIREIMPELSTEVRRQMNVHIGVAGGRVVASPTGSASHRQYTVTGDSVNLAARLAELAAPGKVLISEMVQRTLADRLDCSEFDAPALKGFAMPVRVWRLRGLRMPAPERRPFVGRRAEMRQFQAVLAACQEATEVQHEGIGIAAKLRHDERHTLGHQGGHKGRRKKRSTRFGRRGPWRP
jgi:class 3 adenylate cyclase